MQLQHASYSNGRIIYAGNAYDAQTNRGIKTEGLLGRILLALRGIGTVKVQLTDGTFHYLNKGSCCKLTHEDRKTFLKLPNQKIIEKVQQIFTVYKEEDPVIDPDNLISSDSE